MIILFAAIVLLGLYKIKPKWRGFHEDFIGKAQCDSVKGIFILFVFVRHILQYIVKSGYSFDAMGDRLLYVLDGKLDQLIVVMFLFYSGFGIAESAQRKGQAYIRNLPKNRILPTLLNFDIAVIVFIILNLILQKPMTIANCLASLSGWESVGNSNWYIFDIIAFYFLAYLAFRLTSFPTSGKKAFTVAINIVLTLSFIAIMSRFKPSHWYNTALSFSAGIFLSFYREQIVSLLKKYYALLLPLSIALFVTLFKIHRDIVSLKFNILSIIFAFTVVLTTMKLKIGNRPLQWLGAHLFPLYIYQRVAMIALFEIEGGDFVRNNPYPYVLVSLGCTILIADIYRHWQISIPSKRPENKL